MREYASPTTYVLPATGSLTDDLLDNAAREPDRVAFSRREGEDWVDVTAQAFLEQVRAVARGLLAGGIGEGDRVVLLAATSYEWTLFDYALWYVGAVGVPVYANASPEHVAWILTDSGAVAAVAGTGEQRALLAGLAGPAGLRVWTIRERAVDELSRAGRAVDEGLLERRRAAVTPRSLATVVYTSGTTGRPRGCKLTHGSFMFELGVTVPELDALFAEEDAATLLFLPLPHVFARVVQVGAVRAGVRLGHSGDARALTGDLRSFRPSFVLAVPRVFERIVNTAAQQATADGRARTFARAVETAIAVSRAHDEGGPGPLLRLRHRRADRAVYALLRETLGGRCRYAVSGGAPLGERLGHLYRGIGVTVLEGFGLTETTGAVTVNRPDAVKIGTVGRPLHGCAVRVCDDGELHVRGGQLFAGYWGDDDATARTLGPDGWLRTGDLGEIDDEGYVTVTGRKQEILVTAGGKNVAPAVLEDALRAHPLVSQCLVVGDGRPFVAALLTLDAQAARAWAVDHQRSPDLTRLAEEPALRDCLQHAVDHANRTVSHAESIRRFTVLPVDWTEENGQLTPSLKLRRDVITRQFHDHIEALYSR